MWGGLCMAVTLLCCAQLCMLHMSQIGSMVGRALVCISKHRTGVGPGWLWMGPGPGI